MCRPSDTYIAKDSAINDEIDKLRHVCDSSSFRAEGCDRSGQRVLYLWSGLLRSIIRSMIVSLRPGMVKDRDEVIAAS